MLMHKTHEPCTPIGDKRIGKSVALALTATVQILPGTGRWQAAGLTEGAGAVERSGEAASAPSTTDCVGGPPPRSGEDF